MKKITTILFFCLVNNAILGQSISIEPNNFNNSLNTSKVGTNAVKIEGKAFSNNDDFFYTHGSSSLSLIGNPNFQDPFSGGISNNSIDFFHGNNARWTMGDFFYEDFGNSLNSFQIIDKNNPGNLVPFEIEKGSNKVSIQTLKIKSLESEINDNRFLKISAEGNISAAPNMFLTIGALDLTVLEAGTITKDFGGSFGPNGSPQSIFAPIHLPDGSSFVGFTVTYIDNSPNSSLEVMLKKLNNSTQTIAAVGSANITSNSSNTMSPTIFSGSLIINNQINQYFFEIRPRNQEYNKGGTWDNNLLRLHKIVLEYR